MCLYKNEIIATYRIQIKTEQSDIYGANKSCIIGNIINKQLFIMLLQWLYLMDSKNAIQLRNNLRVCTVYCKNGQRLKEPMRRN